MNATTLQKSHDRVPVCEQAGVSDGVFVFTVICLLIAGLFIGLLIGRDR